MRHLMPFNPPVVGRAISVNVPDLSRNNMFVSPTPVCNRPDIIARNSQLACWGKEPITYDRLVDN